jgi:membrane-associated HD superfamily phosphohydrolase
MSALILISHVKKGVELAREHKLGRSSPTLISQHHGTTLITFFYHKAQELPRPRAKTRCARRNSAIPAPNPSPRRPG